MDVPYRIEGDFSSASYFLAMGAVCGGRVRVGNLNQGIPQGDRRFPDILEEMGCRVEWSGGGILLESDGLLSGIDVEMSGSPDTVQTLCAVAAFARSPTRILGIGHLRHKESDRIQATARALRSLGGEVLVEGDTVTIHPRPLHGGVIDPGRRPQDRDGLRGRRPRGRGRNDQGCGVRLQVVPGVLGPYQGGGAPVRIGLTGFRGTGKTTIGRIVADRLGMPFLDTDQIIEERAGMKIPAIFRDQGEAAFRDLERQAIASLPEDGIVVSAGGGAVLDPVNVSCLRRGSFVFLLGADEEKIISRIGGSDRPSLTGRPLSGEVGELLRQRRPGIPPRRRLLYQTPGRCPPRSWRGRS